MNNCAYREADNKELKKIVFMGACPGINEGKEQRPFSQYGRAGLSLRVLVSVLSKMKSDLFTSGRLDDYTLANAHQKIRRTGTPTLGEINDEGNKARLRKILAGDGIVVVAMGKDAAEASRRVEVEPRFLFPHPTSRKVNKPKRGSWQANWEYWVGEAIK
ncbi:hypothetical protein HUK65_04905 [Rhodobacteraceae bacterium 2376]|uniref:Uracil-DNA glycosylase-like domain-containing protein n=1 Tax=Rhabdonatronobacter sediminivivens TaxID=2743469 RepID=A0A7Z0HY42_9RHOB|nr:hypothetical protein [Rhabdonatronobacter sediminivivens]NYS24325.1 hypothetical protein [Rhabdonatronobacter sediminivivens]